MTRMFGIPLLTIRWMGASGDISSLGFDGRKFRCPSIQCELNRDYRFPMAKRLASKTVRYASWTDERDVPSQCPILER
jgi:hypothetical protein